MKVRFVLAKTGQEAWNTLNALATEAKSKGQSIQEKVALVLTDLEMPEMDGFTLTRNIKQDARFSAVPVVVHSSLSGSASADHAHDLGADGFVAKFSAPVLVSTIRGVLERSRTEA
ncbi:response regulator [Castellaniella sp. FW104-16D08]|uniref:response regulator n=1 Tax=unclassified Castellaniella TaxID=2617606 RepID=UPI0033149BC6